MTQSQNLDVNFAMANTAIKLKDYTSGINYFKNVISLDKAVKSDKYMKALESLGEVYMILNDQVRAEKVFKKII